MPLQPGERLGPYEILSPIGAGGMGEVYRARDPRLNRDVAIKVSAAQFSERFEREAKALAALNHPNICQIYDVGCFGERKNDSPRWTASCVSVRVLASGFLHCWRGTKGRPDVVQLVLAQVPNPCRNDQPGGAINVVFVHDAKRVELFDFMQLEKSARGGLAGPCLLGEAGIPERELDEARREQQDEKPGDDTGGVHLRGVLAQGLQCNDEHHKRTDYAKDEGCHADVRHGFRQVFGPPCRLAYVLQ